MNEQDIPIEIASAKLIEWLESRKIIPKKWQHEIREIRLKIANALNDMPVHTELIKLLSGSYINYFHCLQIIEILKTTEADTKSLFGRYGSKRMSDWQEIVKNYEKDNVYVGEAAEIFQRLNSEVPGLRRHRNKIIQLIDEAQQRIKDLKKTEELLYAEKNTICQQLGIKGVNLKQEFETRIKELPKLYEQITIEIPKIKKSIDFYVEFSGNSEYLPILRHIIQFGNTTVYQYIYKEAPLSIEEAPINLTITIETIQNNDDDNSPQEINFDIDDNAGINYDEVVIIDGGNDDENADIDWGVIEDVSPDNGDNIDFGVSLEESGIEIADSGNDGGIAKGNEALTILDNPIYRDLFFDELYELEAFLQMRQFEFKSDQSNSFLFFLIEGNNQYDLNGVTVMLAQVQNILSLAENEIVEHLHRLKHSSKYADILAEKLNQQVVGVEKSRNTREILKEKIVTLKEENQNIKPEILKLIENSKQLRQQIENDISKRYKGRIVTLYGGIEIEEMDK